MNNTPTQIFLQERGRLMSLAYRMLGERTAAEDVVQNAWLRWSHIDPDTIDTPAAWLTTVTTHLAIDSLRKARRDRETYVGVWLPEPILSDPKTSQTSPTPEDILQKTQEVELALLWAMERLAPEERAAFILREAFDTDYVDIAKALHKTETACRQLIARARKRIAENAPKFNAPSQEVADLLSRFMAAVSAQNKDEILSLLAPDALALTDGGGNVRAALRPLIGAEEITQVFLSIMEKTSAALTAQFVLANGQPAIASLQGTDADLIVTLVPNEQGLIGWIYIMRNPTKLAAPILDLQ